MQMSEKQYEAYLEKFEKGNYYYSNGMKSFRNNNIASARRSFYNAFECFENAFILSKNKNFEREKLAIEKMQECLEKLKTLDINKIRVENDMER